MASETAAILESIVETLRSAGVFASVELGERGSATEVPRANVLPECEETLRPDDLADARWLRLSARVILRTRADNRAEGLSRLMDLHRAAADALLADRFRGGLCRDLPVGRATELGRAEVARGIRRPELEMSFPVRCHYQVQEAQ